MSNKVVKYNNQMNEVNLNGYTEKELNMFFTIIFIAREKHTNLLEISFSNLKELSNGDTHSQRFINTLENVNRKLIRMAHEIQIGNDKHIFSLFNVFTTNTQTQILTVRINEIFAYMLNDLIGNFTKFDLLEFVSLKSSYSKNMFKLLKQWESKKKKNLRLRNLGKYFQFL
ncbi:replication initiation protein [Cetobacterium sp. 2A]|uniref:replication initiation protein n=1 Tax=Cetobacterium sp. 2A TaxID=2754723 RepID=UPI00163B8E01|nr:replication initiation protein [Cetobacterium sp. 2A]MBC2856820.1 replication initiation protein [Cetobacterium sp. 2A]